MGNKENPDCAEPLATEQVAVALILSTKKVILSDSTKRDSGTILNVNRCLQGCSADIICYSMIVSLALITA